MGVFPFSHFPYLKDYQFAIIAKPGVPIYARQEQLAPNFSYHEGGGQPEAFRQRNYLDWFVQQGKVVLDEILANSPTRAQKIILLGHSQGSKVAAKWAVSDPRITHLGYFSGNPQGRIDQQIRTIRAQETKGEISPDSAQTYIEEVYTHWEQINKPDNWPELDFGGDLPKTQLSFSEPTEDELLALDIPIYVAYGTADIGARTCDILPLLFIQAGKTNLTLSAYPGWEHNFFGTKADGSPDYADFHWDEVMQAFMQWVADN